MRRARSGRIGILFLVFSGLWTTQSVSQSVYRSGFERDVNRYLWTSRVTLAERVGAWSVDLTNDFRSDAFILFDDKLSFRDENRSRMTLRRPLGLRTLSVYETLGWFSLSRVLKQDLMAGLKFRGPQGSWFEPLVGLSLDSRPGIAANMTTNPIRTDAGPAIGFRLGIPSTLVDDYLIRLDGEGRFQQITPRRGRMLRAIGSAERTFEDTSIKTRILASSVRRDAYEAASFLNRRDDLNRISETVESTRSDTLAATLILDRPFSSGLSLGGRIDVSANRRLVRTLRAPESALFFDSDFSRRIVEGELSTAYSRRQTMVRLAFRLGAEVERRSLANESDLPAAQASQKLNLLRQADYDRGFVTLRLDSHIPFGSRTTLQASGSANILRHDTPAINPDDRDELFYNGTIGLQYRLSPELDIQMQIFGTYFHTSYIKSSRSSENNIQRSLRFRPAVKWRPGRDTRLELNSEVRATYTVDDFVLQGRRPTDQSARELRYHVEGSHDFGGGIRLLMSASVSDLHLGRFLDDVFAEIPFDTLATSSAWVRIQVGTRVQADIGIRSFIRSDYNRSTSVRYFRPSADGTGPDVDATVSRPGRERIAQIGPTASLTWPLRDGAFLRLVGWATIQRITQKLYGDLPEASEDIIRTAGRRGSQTLIPNLAISMQWTL
jgi:hypothetical protein